MRVVPSSGVISAVVSIFEIGGLFVYFFVVVLSVKTECYHQRGFICVVMSE